ncbi:MAG: class I SAM-dependent methyltransferase [Ilumatobacteraceae bacterium]
MGTITWGRDVAEVYDVTSSAMFAPSLLEPTVERLYDLAVNGPAGGAALEFAIGTGRVAVPLHARGVAVTGIELSPHMIEQLVAKPGAVGVDVVVGDMTSTRVPGEFALVYLVYNTIMNVTTLDEQVAVFANAAAHLAPGGCFVVEVVVPQLRSVPPGELGRVFTLEADHVGVETFDDPVGQISWSHHWMNVDGRFVGHSAPYRYIWPAELELMGRLAGFRLRDRWADWVGTEFDASSTSQVAVFEKLC